MTIESFIQVGTLLLSFAAMYIALKKANPEIRVGNSGADKNLAEAMKVNSDAAIVLNARLVERLNQLETELAGACEELTMIRDHIQAIEAENHLLRDWATRLTGQVVSLGGTPVKIAERKI